MSRVLILLVLATFALSAAEAPFIGSAEVKARFASITDGDMESLRQKRILFASRSFGLNLCKGLAALERQNPRYRFLDSYQRFDVFRAGGDVSIIPADAFEHARFVHFLATFHPFAKRVQEMDDVLRRPPHSFGKIADVVVIFFHTASPEAFAPYASRMDALRSDFPRIRFIYVTAGFQGPEKSKENEAAHAFSELVRKRYRGKVPLYDLGAILSDDFRAGHCYCPEYSKDPAGVHPNTDAGETMMAKGFLLALRDACGMGDSGARMADGVGGPERSERAETLPPTHPEHAAVRAILDANGLEARKVDGVAVVRGGHVVELYLQEAGIQVLPDPIGALGSLEKLHLYADRSLPLRRLQTVSPAIGRCTHLRELLLTDNDLRSLPPEVAALRALKKLSVANNCLRDLPEAVRGWAERFDPQGLRDQREP